LLHRRWVPALFAAQPGFSSFYQGSSLASAARRGGPAAEQPGLDGECLNADDHEWGTYTYDLIVLEFEDDVPQNSNDWTQANVLDWNFLKRYRDGYHLWVPENLPPPDDEEPGHHA
jgi:hypothetical protein